jgi:hypothetical protein
VASREKKYFFNKSFKENYANEQTSKKNVGKRGLGFGSSINAFEGTRVTFNSQGSKDDKINTENDEAHSFSIIISPPKVKVKCKIISLVKIEINSDWLGRYK